MNKLTDAYEVDEDVEGDVPPVHYVGSPLQEPDAAPAPALPAARPSTPRSFYEDLLPPAAKESYSLGTSDDIAQEQDAILLYDKLQKTRKLDGDQSIHAYASVLIMLFSHCQCKRGGC
jgi:hypothetical protein